MSLPKRLKEFRKRAGIDRKKLARKVGQPTLWIRYIEEDMPGWKELVKFSDLEKLADALSVTVYDFFAPNES